jgi:hypothetical protein
MGPTVGPEAAPGHPRLLALAAPFVSLIAGPVGKALPRAIRPVVPHAELAVKAFSKVAPKADRPILLDPAFGAVLVGDILHVMDDGLAAPLHDLRLFGKDWGFRLRDVRVPVCFFRGARSRSSAAEGTSQATSTQGGSSTPSRPTCPDRPRSPLRRWSRAGLLRHGGPR